MVVLFVTVPKIVQYRCLSAGKGVLLKYIYIYIYIHRHASNHHIRHIKLIQCYILNISQGCQWKKKWKKKTKGEGINNLGYSHKMENYSAIKSYEY